jgi:hypothetical protein
LRSHTSKNGPIIPLLALVGSRAGGRSRDNACENAETYVTAG